MVHSWASLFCGTYNVTDDEGTLQCNLCNPGSYVIKDCTKNASTLCGLCQSGTYNNGCSKAPRCESCSLYCDDKYGLTAKSQCTPMSDRQCDCKDGFWRSDDQEPCIPHKSCGLGEGAIKGTSSSDTICTPCKNETFSDIERNKDQMCKTWTDCKELELQELGNSTKDTTCFSPAFTTIEPPSGSVSGLTVGLSVGCPLLILVVVALIVIVCCVRHRRRKKKKSRRRPGSGTSQNGLVASHERPETSIEMANGTTSGSENAVKGLVQDNEMSEAHIKMNSANGHATTAAKAVEMESRVDETRLREKDVTSFSLGDDEANDGMDLENNEDNTTERITLALIDMGFRTDHTSFNGLSKYHTLELCHSFEDSCEIDNEDHGTAVLDVLLKTCGNDVKLNLILIKVDSRKIRTVALTDAFNWLLKWKHDTGKPVHIVSTSLGSLTHSDELMKAANELCLSSVVVTAASNEGLKDSNTISYPSLYGNTICMGAHGAGYRATDYSPQGKELTFLGPGNYASVASSSSTAALKSVMGTSFAAPQMAACVACILALIGSLPNGQNLMQQMGKTFLMKQLLIEFSSEQSNPRKTYGYGRVKAEEINKRSLYRALEKNCTKFGISV